MEHVVCVFSRVQLERRVILQMRDPRRVGVVLLARTFLRIRRGRRSGPVVHVLHSRLVGLEGTSLNSILCAAATTTTTAAAAAAAAAG